ncbi:MAG: hypothetical protein WC526_04610 [Patescibacteria group bacterium]
MKKYKHFSGAVLMRDELKKKFGTPKWLAGIVVMHTVRYGYLVEVRVFGKAKFPKLPRLPLYLRDATRVRFRRVKKTPEARLKRAIARFEDPASHVADNVALSATLHEAAEAHSKILGPHGRLRHC